MFSFAIISGVKNGWLDAKTYGPAARRSWIAVAGYVDQNDNVTSVCEGTGKKNELSWYMERKEGPETFTGKRRFCGQPQRCYASIFILACVPTRMQCRAAGRYASDLNVSLAKGCSSFLDTDYSAVHWP